MKTLTAAENRSLAPGEILVIVNGSIDVPLAEELERLLAEAEFEKLILDLDSAGGRLSYTERVVAILQDIRDTRKLTTYVRNGSDCLSACVAVFAQGEARIAGGASAWLFHGVCRAFADLPIPQETDRFVEILRASGTSDAFLADIRPFLSSPGELWFSGYELHRIHEANIITLLLDPWRPTAPGAGPESFGE